MRRRGRRRRFVGLFIGTAFFAALTLGERPPAPEPPYDPGAARIAAPIAVAPLAAHAALALAAVPAAAGAPRNDKLPDAEPTGPTWNIEVRAGDTPLKLLMRMGIAADEAHAAVRSLSTVWDPRDLRAGQRVAVNLQADRLLSLRLVLAPGREVAVARDDAGGFVAEDQERPTNWVPTLGSGAISTTLSEAANHAGAPPGVVEELIRAFSYDVDFQREIRSGDTFALLYERMHAESGEPVALGRLAYGELVLSGTRRRLYRFTPPGGDGGFFTALGESIRKPLLRTPVDAIRITSSFGIRFHPILGYNRLHRGVDFAAPSGTRIYAAGDGVVTYVGRASGYGNYVEIEHNRQYTTAYGHLSGFARNLREGERVRQGEVIGYVGMTGLATGPHLHYEVHDHGAQVDPLTIKMPALTRLAGDQMKAFQVVREAIDRQLLDLRRDLVAQAGCAAGPRLDGGNRCGSLAP